MSILIDLFAYLCCFYLFLPSILIWTGKLSEKKQARKRKNLQPICPDIIVTVYESLDPVRPLIRQLATMNNPAPRVYIVCDAVEEIKADQWEGPICYLKPPERLGLKLKSIDYAFQHASPRPDYFLILDADNLLHPEFLEEVQAYLDQGYNIIQGKRVAGNLNSATARVDSISEIYKNYVDRELPFRMGSSASLAGSAIVLSSELLGGFLNLDYVQKNFSNKNKLIAEDKLLQNYAVSFGERIAFADNAMVFDGKVDSYTELKKQRSKWLYAYFQNTSRAARLVMQGLFNLDWNGFLFGLVSLSPPVVVLLGLSIVAGLLSLFGESQSYILVITGIAVFISGIISSLYFKRAPQSVWRSLYHVPAFAWTQVRALLRLFRGKKSFGVTRNISKSEDQGN